MLTFALLFGVALFLLIAPIALHEAAHWAVLRRLGYPVSTVEIGLGPVVLRVGRLIIRVLPIAGGVTPCQDLELIHWRHRFMVAMAGPLASAAYASLMLWGVGLVPSHNEGIRLIGMLSLFMALFNLLPIPGLDGGVALRALMQGAGFRVPAAKPAMNRFALGGFLLLAVGCFWLFTTYMFPTAFHA